MARLLISTLSLVAVASAVEVFVDEPFSSPSWAAGSVWSLSGTFSVGVVQRSTDSPSYALRLTDTGTSKAGALQYNIAQPVIAGLNV